MALHEGLEVLGSLLNLLQVEVEDLLLALPEAIALPDELVFPFLQVIDDVFQGRSGARRKLLALLLMNIQVVRNQIQMVVEREAEWAGRRARVVAG